MADHTQEVHGCTVAVTRGKQTRGAGSGYTTGKLQVTRSMGRMELTLLVGHHTQEVLGIATARMGAKGVRKLMAALQQQLDYGLPEED